MTRNPDKFCTSNLKTCPIDRGGCGYRYKEGDAKWQDDGSCPICSFSRRCTRYRVIGSTVCQIHGIGSIRQGRIGGENGHKTTDLRRAFLPKQMAQTYEHAMNDPNLRRFDRNLALQESMIVDSIKRINTGESGEAWKELSKELPDFIDTLRSLSRDYQFAYTTIATEGMTPERRQSLETAITGLVNTISGSTPEYLMSIIKKGRYAWAARNEALAWEEQQRKTKESDMRQLKDLKAMVAIDQFIRFTEAVAVTIEKRIDDPDLRRAIGFDVQQLLSLPDGIVVDIRGGS